MKDSYKFTIVPKEVKQAVYWYDDYEHPTFIKQKDGSTVIYSYKGKKMKQSRRLIIYSIVGLPIPILSYILYPELGIGTPLVFTGLVTVLATIIEIVYYKQRKK